MGASLTEHQLERLAETFVEGLTVIHGELLTWANHAAGQLLGLRQAPPCRLAETGAIGAALQAALDEIDHESLGCEHHARLEVGGTALRCILMRTDRHHAAALIYQEAPRQDLGRILMEQLDLSAAEARLALRLLRRASCPEIARGFGISAEALKKRVSRLCRRLGVRRRTELLPIVLRTLCAGGAPGPGAGEG